MAYTIQTNIASIQSQEYLRLSSDFQAKTINRVTSGLRIISSGDDAAGLAIANGFRSDRAVLTQGIRNANDGLSNLQTIDGGINNISQLLDRARTLAAQSASGSFTGDRTVLNSEFTSVLDEIDRQAQAIGLNTGGTFASTVAVFIGGGRGSTSAAQITNGTASVDLSTSTVDTQSLGLKGYQAAGGVAGTTDLGGSSTTSISNILANTVNTASEATSGFTDFYFRGPAFSGANRVKVSVNVSSVSDGATLATAINSAIDAAGLGGTQYATSFKNAGIKASIVTDSATGKTRLAFTSSSGVFQVAAGDRVSNALLGNYSAGSTGVDLTYTVTGAATAATTGTTFAAAANVIVRIQGSSLGGPQEVTLAVTTSTTVDTALSSLSSAVANNSSLQGAGITVTTSAASSNLVFTAKRGELFEVTVAGDTSNRLGLGTSQIGTGGAFDASAITGSSGTFTTAGTNQLVFSVGGGSYSSAITVTTTTTTAVADVVNTLNTAFSQNSELQAAGLYASTSGGQVVVSSSSGSYFRLNVSAVTGSVNLGFGTVAGVTTSTTSSTFSTVAATVNSGGASTSGLLAFTAIRNGNDDQSITVTAVDSSGTERSLAITLDSDSSGTPTARSIDEAIAYINTQLQASTSNPPLLKIVAVKENDAGTEKIRFLSSNSAFKVALGTNPGTTGFGTSIEGTVVSSSTLSGGATADITSKGNAETAVSSLSTAVSLLGKAQAQVGKGQNQFNFAVSLAQTQLNNIAASESRIRDADLASEAANLTKAQILQQAGIAALAQANVAPQVVLSLLRG